MGFKLYLITLMVVLAMVARSSAKVHDASWTLSHFGDHDDESLLDSANSKVGDLIGEENEMMMESESTRRTLRGRGTRYIGYGALRRNAVPCGRRGRSYYNCQGRQRANPYKRGCRYITRCARR
ncbi:protein RALF-like 19 [Pyrus x bretschneideri]|uniref:Rapid alkalinization factor 6 n=1 Tax=Pyrus x bretschneideri TaxID=225117 RepID=A0A650ERV8_9ROSA|nr:protein RALF-like 19 [Pyrus x bretschneideri]QGT52201.1 rapid alkalinization factor 6 [Pyrus x bretschneideri]